MSKSPKGVNMGWINSYVVIVREYRDDPKFKGHGKERWVVVAIESTSKETADFTLALDSNEFIKAKCQFDEFVGWISKEDLHEMNRIRLEG
jgi:uncharacterized protein YifN (PemK superfamily)